MPYPNPISSPYAEFKAMVHLSLTKKQFQFLHSVFNNYEWFSDDEAKLYYEVEADLYKANPYLCPPDRLTHL